MNKPIVIAVDAMGGDNSPKKIIDGIELYSQKNNNIFYRLFGDKKLIEKLLINKKINNQNYEIIHTEDSIKDEDSALVAAKRGKKTQNLQRWVALTSVVSVYHTHAWHIYNGELNEYFKTKNTHQAPTCLVTIGWFSACYWRRGSEPS